MLIAKDEATLARVEELHMGAWDIAHAKAHIHGA